MAAGLLRLAPWARHLQIATAAVGLFVCPFTLASATVLLYMARPEVKAAFEGGRAGVPDGASEATFALSLLGMLAVGAALAAIAALVADEPGRAGPLTDAVIHSRNGGSAGRACAGWPSCSLEEADRE
jgi:hypothetical protein